MYNAPMKSTDKISGLSQNNLPQNNLPYNNRDRFWKDGYLVMPGFANPDLCDQFSGVAQAHLNGNMGPIEYEVDVQYPGSPTGQDSEGAMTPRRLLHAYSRDRLFRDWSTSRELKRILSDLFGTGEVRLSQCHHNCVMTKHPGFSSVTLWHQDNRYWNFDEPNLISVWLALGDERRDNGCLRIIPGSHHLEIDRGRFDAAIFLRPDLKENKDLIKQASPVVLHQGDVLFFHSRLFHAAGRNLTEATKYSLVFTYHTASNEPISNTRSSRYRSIAF